MLQAHELFALARDLANRKVLSVYLDSRVIDPAERHAWRAALASGLRAAREGIADEEERARFDKAAGFFEQPMPSPGGLWAAPGWAAFATDNNLVTVSSLPRRVETIVRWGRGAVIGPYLRALKHERPVIVALVQSRTAELFRYANGVLERLDGVRLMGDESVLRSGRPTRVQQRGRAHPGARNALQTEVARQRQLAQLRRLASSLAARLTLLVGQDGVLLVDGPAAWTREVMNALPRQVRVRSRTSSELDRASSAESIVREAKRAARELRSRHGRDLVSRILDHLGHRAVTGVPGLQRALSVNAVDLFLVSPRFLQGEPVHAERLLQAALSGGADVEVLSGEPGVLLDALADGVAARLRFPIDTAVAVPTNRRTAMPFAPSAS